MESIIAEGLTKRFNTIIAVDHISFRIREGEVFGLLGPNGAGKTTTIRMLSCLIKPSEGFALVGGYDIIKESNKVREIVGVLTENPSLYERLTAYENLWFFAEAYGISDTNERDGRIRELLEFFDLWGRRGDKVGTFSRGMKQKLAIARALVHRPPIIFLDEPTAGLDPESAKEIRDLIGRLSKHEKCTILLCTHRLEDAEKLCSKVMIINKGKNIAIGSLEELARLVGKPTLQIGLLSINEKITDSLKALKEVKDVFIDPQLSRLILNLDDESSTPKIVKEVVHAGGMILSVNMVYPSLEEVYLKLIREGTA
ncbi:MAG: ABC transporter ATP-binding protein [Crenarchaeota archaeon]|nr:ABC transporter ATP-binding protein [Thermoproteota archaeon]MDW8033744.1 ABC transporter ATP-binding protein [Nitrososphaerota archaeon]